MRPPQITYVVRHRITVARHLERYSAWLSGEQIPALRKSLPEIGGVRHYKEEKDELVRLTFYDLAEGCTWTPSTRAVTQRIREAWYAFGPDMRDFSAQPFGLIWSGGSRASSDGPRPLIVERLTVVPEKEDAWNAWSEKLWQDELRDLPLAGVERYWALTGDPRFYLQVQVFEDDQGMRDKIKASEPKTRPQYWEGWASWMPYVGDLGRYVFIPVAV